ncbi:cytochrome b [Pseudomonas sp. R1-18]|uniref:cytochrome b n=1 Tax=Pseudomonas sp. R1-18 TaxID=1632772 RepID=UPI003DAA27A0
MDSPHLQRYSPKARRLHWIMAVLIVLAYALILSRTQFSRGSDYRILVVQSHFWVGILILLMTFMRVSERRKHTPPGITPPLQGILQKVATLSHYALYAFLFVQPVLGLLTVLVEKGALPIPLTSWQIPSPFQTSDRVAESFEDLHKLLATIFYYVIGLHVVAALWHHWIRKDNALQRML